MNDDQVGGLGAEAGEQRSHWSECGRTLPAKMLDHVAGQPDIQTIPVPAETGPAGAQPDLAHGAIGQQRGILAEARFGSEDAQNGDVKTGGRERDRLFPRAGIAAEGAGGNDENLGSDRHVGALSTVGSELARAVGQSANKLAGLQNTSFWECP